MQQTSALVQCVKCGELQEPDAFYKNPTKQNPERRRADCKSCKLADLESRRRSHSVPARRPADPNYRMGPCSACGAMRFKGKTSLPDGMRTCNDCRRAGLGPTQAQHGTERRYKLGCRCDVCREHWNRVCRDRGCGSWISSRRRREIYERDEWICQLCGGMVDGSLDANDSWAATLDHIVPVSWGLFPDHRPENLRLAHRSCNSVRGDARGN